MSMLQWAENEVELAIKKLDKTTDKLLIETYLDALDVFKLIIEKSDSGLQYNLFTSVIQRLMDNMPLTPLTGHINEFTFVYSVGDKGVYQNKRRSSLFCDATTGNDGFTHTLYRDNDRCVCVYASDPSGVMWHNSFVSRIINERFPIIFPYMPTKPIKVLCEQFKANKDNNGDYDMLNIKGVVFPDGTEQPINLYFVEEFGKWEEVTEREYNSFKSLSLNVKERSDKSEGL